MFNKLDFINSIFLQQLFKLYKSSDKQVNKLDHSNKLKLTFDRILIKNLMTTTFIETENFIRKIIP